MEGRTFRAALAADVAALQDDVVDTDGNLSTAASVTVVEASDAAEVVDWTQRSDELFAAREDAQSYMLDVVHAWEDESYFFETREQFEAGYQARIDELNARCEESCDIIDTMSDSDGIKEHFKEEIREERDEYLETMQRDYESASSIYS